MENFERNHYVPKWYQYRFLPPDLKQKKFFYLDLKPSTVISGGHPHKRNALLRWGPRRCFAESHLYTTQFASWKSTEIEEKFFGVIDSTARAAVEYFSTFEHPSVEPDYFHTLVRYMSIQKLRTPKGLADVANMTNLATKNATLLAMQNLRQIFCAVWTECVWSIADASTSDTKFILSDHPVTVYNPECFPFSKWCRDWHEPDIRYCGTHTFFPLGLDKILILTNLSRVRDFYSNPLKARPNPGLFRPAVFNFFDIQTGRMLTDIEVNEINYVIKRRAYRYVAAAEEEWLYPEAKIPSAAWDKLGKGYLFMPDPRPMSFSSEIVMGYKNKRVDAFDPYGRKPWQQDYKAEDARSPDSHEWESFHAFQGEFARVIGPKRRGQIFEMDRLSEVEDSADWHAHLLREEGVQKAKFAKKNWRVQSRRGKKRR